MPRLPEDWNLNIEDFNIENTQSTINIKSTYPTKENNKVELSINNPDPNIKEVKYRLGPLPLNTKDISVNVNGENIKANTFISGDYKWAWITLNPNENNFVINVSRTNSVKLNMQLLSIIIPIIIAGLLL